MYADYRVLKEKAKSHKRRLLIKDLKSLERKIVTQDEFYISMRKEWRDKENVRILFEVFRKRREQEYGNQVTLHNGYI